MRKTHYAVKQYASIKQSGFGKRIIGWKSMTCSIEEAGPDELIVSFLNLWIFIPSDYSNFMEIDFSLWRVRVDRLWGWGEVVLFCLPKGIFLSALSFYNVFLTHSFLLFKGAKYFLKCNCPIQHWPVLEGRLDLLKGVGLVCSERWRK